MPSWKIHNKYTRKIGISKEISNFVNLLIDFPENCQEFQDFCNKEDDIRVYRRSKVISISISSFIRHDSGRRKKTAMYVQLRFLHQKGNEYIKSWYLHHILDYIKGAPILTVDNILKRFRKKVEYNQELDIIEKFVTDNLEDIVKDCRI